MEPTIVNYYLASEKGDAILAELDDRLRDESANGYLGMTTPGRKGTVDIGFEGTVDEGLAHKRVAAVLDEIDPQAGEHVKRAERTETA